MFKSLYRFFEFMIYALFKKDGENSGRPTGFACYMGNGTAIKVAQYMDDKGVVIIHVRRKIRPSDIQGGRLKFSWLGKIVRRGGKIDSVCMLPVESLPALLIALQKAKAQIEKEKVMYECEAAFLTAAQSLHQR